MLSEARALIADEVFAATPRLPKMIGATLPLHASAVGKALLAGQPPERREAAKPPQSITDRG